jgi:hypothetical protein
VSDSKYKKGAVVISKGTANDFYIEVENESGEQMMSVKLTPEQFAHGITGKHIKCLVRTTKAARKDNGEG